jgi:hypothetical protein
VDLDNRALWRHELKIQLDPDLLTDLHLADAERHVEVDAESSRLTSPDAVSISLLDMNPVWVGRRRRSIPLALDAPGAADGIYGGDRTSAD